MKLRQNLAAAEIDQVEVIQGGLGEGYLPAAQLAPQSVHGLPIEVVHGQEVLAVLDADLYKSTRTVLFKEAFPERFIDVGISEADMISMAAGLAAVAALPPELNPVPEYLGEPFALRALAGGLSALLLALSFLLLLSLYAVNRRFARWHP